MSEDNAVNSIFSMQLPEVVELTEILGSEDLAVKAVEYFGEEALIERRMRNRLSISGSALLAFFAKD